MSDPWGPYIREASQTYDVPERWIREVMRQESGGRLYARNGDLITSGAGAMGLMQVMPATYDELRSRYDELGPDPFHPRNNIRAGTAYIREMYDIFGSPGFLAAYNAGPGRMDDHLTRNRSLPRETRDYVASIGPRIRGASPLGASPGAQYARNQASAGRQYASGGQYIKLNPPTAYTPPAAPVAAPVQIARGPTRGGPFIALNPPERTSSAPVQVATLPPPAPVRMAQLPAPYRPAPPTQRALAAAALVPAQPPASRFSFVSPANASQPGRGGSGPAADDSAAGDSETGDWAVQVGAFANRGVAVSVAGAARKSVQAALGGAHANVTSVRQADGILYRARLTGLSRDSAAAACERLARTRTQCIVVSPDAQS